MSTKKPEMIKRIQKGSTVLRGNDVGTVIGHKFSISFDLLYRVRFDNGVELVNENLVKRIPKTPRHVKLNIDPGGYHCRSCGCDFPLDVHRPGRRKKFCGDFCRRNFYKNRNAK